MDQQNQQGTSSIAIGPYAGNSHQGTNSIAIGGWAGYATSFYQPANSIILNATGSSLNNSAANSFTVKPIRNSTGTNVLYYDTSSGEITSGPNYGASASKITQFVNSNTDVVLGNLKVSWVPTGITNTGTYQTNWFGLKFGTNSGTEKFYMKSDGSSGSNTTTVLSLTSQTVGIPDGYPTPWNVYGTWFVKPNELGKENYYPNEWITLRNETSAYGIEYIGNGAWTTSTWMISIEKLV